MPGEAGVRARGGLAKAGMLGGVRAIRVPLGPVQTALLLLLLTIPVVFMLYPLLRVLAIAFTADRRPSIHLRNSSARPLFPTRFQRELGTTTICVTYDQEGAFALSDRIAVMDGRRIVQEGTPQQAYLPEAR